jgi:hypothetical protein
MVTSMLERPALWIFFLIAAQYSQATLERTAIAVNDFSAQGIDKAAAGIITDRIRDELLSTGYFRVLERAEMETILKEHGFQLTGACEQSCAVQIGKVLEVKKIITGSVGKL